MHNLRDPAVILNDRGRLEDQIALLPTPDAAVSNNGEDPTNWLARRERQAARGINGNGMGTPLAMAVQLLPTPASRDGKGRDLPERDGGAGLPSTVLDGKWDKYAPAIEHWARWLGRPAPEPTVPGRRGGRRLSPVLVEWMMGLPEGWVTGVPDLSANAMLKALGNGVCPQQATLAIDRLLSHYALG